MASFFSSSRASIASTTLIVSLMITINSLLEGERKRINLELRDFFHFGERVRILPPITYYSRSSLLVRNTHLRSASSRQILIMIKQPTKLTGNKKAAQSSQAKSFFCRPPKLWENLDFDIINIIEGLARFSKLLDFGLVEKVQFFIHHNTQLELGRTKKEAKITHADLCRSFFAKKKVSWPILNS